MRDALARLPRREQQILTRQYERELQSFRDDLDAALALTQVGETPASEVVPPDALAAMTIVCSTIMNSDASVMRR